MTVSKELIQELIDYAVSAQEVKPIVDEFVKAIKLYGKEVGDLLESVNELLVSNRIKNYIAYKSVDMPEDLIYKLMTSPIDYSNIVREIASASVRVNTNK